EMVSLTAVEQELDLLYPDAKQGVLAVADEKKGEKLILITSAEKATIADIQQYLRSRGLSDLWFPKEVVYIKNPPLLGSGKFDYQSAEKLYISSVDKM
ncbi:MAG: 2-acylglycerophosphoethanolamine acyltransferase, partial [Alphaproteobacteria bacterium]|nr:2-acylglycerophosphoethanolamine acyltransferase [Alphaproteobacteria bacterium]